MNRFAGALLIGGAAIVAWNMFAPIEYTIPARMGQLLGAFEDEWTRARTPAVAEQAAAIREAEAQVQRKTLAATRAIEAEADVMRRQVAATNSTHWVQAIVGNLADGACALGVASQVMGSEDSGDLLSFCAVGDEIRRGMSEDYAQSLNSSRSSLIEDMQRSFDEVHGAPDERAAP